MGRNALLGLFYRWGDIWVWFIMIFNKAKRYQNHFHASIGAHKGCCFGMMSSIIHSLVCSGKGSCPFEHTDTPQFSPYNLWPNEGLSVIYSWKTRKECTHHGRLTMLSYLWQSDLHSCSIKCGSRIFPPLNTNSKTNQSNQKVRTPMSLMKSLSVFVFVILCEDMLHLIEWRRMSTCRETANGNLQCFTTCKAQM